ncbi:MAG: DUF1398 family protein [Chitinophagaceae bacterium]
MFTAEQIKAAHSKVKSGADFPAYIREIKGLGVTQYEAFVADGHITYYGDENQATTPPKYVPVVVGAYADTTSFIAELKAHQKGETDFMHFIMRCAELGINKWCISMVAMTCTYFDRDGKEVLIELIPD